MDSDTVVLSVQIGIIGGSGLDDPDILEGRTERYVDTPYGKVRFHKTGSFSRNKLVLVTLPLQSAERN